MNFDDFETLLDLAIDEDLGGVGDVTTRAICDFGVLTANLVAKQDGILCGTDIFTNVFRRINPEVDVKFTLKDGDRVVPGVVAAIVEGPTVSILEGERIALNFVSFMSGIATATSKYVEAARKAGRAVVLDTRKTIPGYRALSKYAVSVGGGVNHRMGLYDMVLIKDNHVDAAGGVRNAVERARAKWADRFRVEVECRTIEEVREAVACGVDVIMLDNMTPAQAAAAVREPHGGIKFEASGGMDLAKTADYSAVGVDYISVGRITHSAPAFDFALKIRRAGGGDAR